jgi:hypothetical protein
VILVFQTHGTMETPEFKDFAHSMIDFIGDYLDNIRDRCAII